MKHIKTEFYVPNILILNIGIYFFKNLYDIKIIEFIIDL